jgi:hypothetical protein
MTMDINNFSDIENRDATITQAKTYLDHAWKLLVLRAGRKEAERFVLSKMGFAKPGRPHNDDEIDHQIKWYLTIAQAMKVRKISTKEIANAILASPPHKRTYRTNNGPNAGWYIDSDTGEKEFDPDLELDSVPVEIKLKVRSLVTRVERIRNKMIKAGKLAKKYKKDYARAGQ